MGVKCALALSLVGWASLAILANGDVFLEKTHSTQQLGPQAPPILEELERVLGREHRVAAESRVQRLEEVLRPTFMAMPKVFDGGLAPDGVRYVLHRIFVDRHGWFVKGLDAAGEAWNSSSPAAVFKNHDGGEAHDFFNGRLANHSFNLHHIAVLAATLEIFVHAETLDRLHAAYRLLGLSRFEDSGDEEVTAKAIDSYLLMYVLGSNHSSMTPSKLDESFRNILAVYPTWEATETWARSVRREVLDAEDKPAEGSFNTTVRVLEVVGDRYGRWQDQECRDIKSSLLKMEKSDSGRVWLSTFYASALAGNWQFSENVDYLRQLGALDESDPEALSVIIPNYINAPSNCVASSKFYSVCCIDECEALLGHLETHIAAPDASPARILELVSELASPTTKAPRTLPAQMVKRIQDIAAQHRGTVPLHSRLFTQWMHHAYPRECIYPHITGTTKPLTIDQWENQTGLASLANEETMRWHVEEGRKAFAAASSKKTTNGGEADELPWSMEEELKLYTPAAAETEQVLETSSLGAGHGLGFMAIVCFISLLIARTFMTIKDDVTASERGQHQHVAFV